jgi:hypothetical protein
MSRRTIASAYFGHDAIRSRSTKASAARSETLSVYLSKSWKIWKSASKSDRILAMTLPPARYEPVAPSPVQQTQIESWFPFRSTFGLVTGGA